MDVRKDEPQPLHVDVAYVTCKEVTLDEDDVVLVQVVDFVDINWISIDILPATLELAYLIGSEGLISLDGLASRLSRVVEFPVHVSCILSHGAVSPPSPASTSFGVRLANL